MRFFLYDWERNVSEGLRVSLRFVCIRRPVWHGLRRDLTSDAIIE